MKKYKYLKIFSLFLFVIITIGYFSIDTIESMIPIEELKVQEPSEQLSQGFYMYGLDYALKNLPESDFRLVRYLEKPTAFYFYFSQCEHCLLMLEEMQQTKLFYDSNNINSIEDRGNVLKKFGNPIEYIGIQCDGTTEDVDKIQSQYKQLKKILLIDPVSEGFQKVKVKDFSFFLVSRGGDLYHRSSIKGIADWPSEKVAKSVCHFFPPRYQPPVDQLVPFYFTGGGLLITIIPLPIFLFILYKIIKIITMSND